MQHEFDVLAHLRNGGRVRRRCWIGTIHMRYEPTDVYGKWKLVIHKGIATTDGLSELISAEDWVPYNETKEIK